MTTNGEDGVQFHLDEACYYLAKIGVNTTEISERMQKSESNVKKMIQKHRARIKSGEVEENEFDQSFWEDVMHESQGDLKVTFAKSDGFYHYRKSDLENMDGSALLEIFEAGKQFLEMDLSYQFGILDKKRPVGYDPLILPREIKKSVEIVELILKERETPDMK
tara:strand:+ start:81 stop:572 length:492 start_codon:yes stop_codon:yes gene_type:complete